MFLQPIPLHKIFLSVGVSSFSLSVAQQKIKAPQQTSIADTATLLKEVVVTASGKFETLLQAPVSVSKIGGKALTQSPSADIYETLTGAKGVHAITPSLGFRILNTRGFNNTTNVRFVQMVDMADNQSPHIGAPIANALCPSDLDIENVEIVQGVAAAVYGMNATNGIANISTKSPFTFTGLSIRQQTAVNHFASNESRPQLYTETAIRWAHKLNSQLAYKINLAYNKGYDWVANNQTDLNNQANASTGLFSADNPGYDGVNIYGNESSNRQTLNLAGKNYVVARTGYAEKQVTDYHLNNLKYDVSLFFHPSEKLKIVYTFRSALLNNVYQRSNRFRLADYTLQQHQLNIKGSFWQMHSYITSENTGNSYNLRSMAENIDAEFKSNSKWFADFTKRFNSSYSGSNNMTDALQAARSFADSGRLQPGTDGFKNQLSKLQQVNNWDSGAALKVRASLLHSELMVDVSKKIQLPFSCITGVDYRDYNIIPDGNYFINPTNAGQNLHYRSYGAFTRISKNFAHNRWQLGGAVRVSKFDYFDAQINPRLTLVFTPQSKQTWRLSWQTGYRFPSIFEGFSNINSGGVKRVGGLKVMSSGIFENSWLKSSIDAFKAAVNKDVNTQGLTQQQAITKNAGLLQKNTYTYVQPEQVQSFELGYRRGLANDKIWVEADAYFNKYNNFIAQIEASVPNTTNSSEIPTKLYSNSTQARYRLWTNSTSVVYNYGITAEIQYQLQPSCKLKLNASYQTLQKTGVNDGLEDGYNTPNWMANLSILKSSFLHPQADASLGIKYQNSYWWQSFLVNGKVDAFVVADAMVQYRYKKLPVALKLGANNLFNHYYYSILGGPQVGGFYYSTITYNIL